MSIVLFCNDKLIIEEFDDKIVIKKDDTCKIKFYKIYHKIREITLGIDTSDASKCYLQIITNNYCDIKIKYPYNKRFNMLKDYGRIVELLKPIMINQNAQ